MGRVSASLAVIEPVCRGLEHVPINAALIAALATGAPSRDIDVYGEATHLQEVSNLLTATRPSILPRVRFVVLNVPERKVKGLTRARQTLTLFRTLRQHFTETPPSSIVCTTADPWVIGFVKLGLLGRGGHGPTLLVLHELLASLEAPASSSRRRLLLAALALPHPNRLSYVVLSGHITKHLADMAPGILRHTIAIEHPSVIPDVGVPDVSATPGGPAFGFVGGGRDAKGFSVFLKLAKAVLKEHPSARFEVVGSAPVELAADAPPGLIWSSEKLPLQDFVNRLRTLTHVIWLGDPEHYRLVASGSLVDVMALGIPVIAQSGPLVEHLFKRYPGIDSTHESVEGLAQEIIRIARTPETTPPGGTRALRRSPTEGFLPETAAKTLATRIR